MDFKLNEDQEMVRDTARDFAQEQIAPIAAELDEQARFPEKIIKELSELGFMGISIPEKYEGAELDTISYVLILEEIAKACASTALTMNAHNSLTCGTILQFANDMQKKKYLPKLATGEWLGAFSITEANADSDISNVQTKAILEGDNYIINGIKTFVINGAYADVFILIARTNFEGNHSEGLSAFIVEKNFQGLKIGKNEDKMGMRAASTTELILDNLKVPKENLILEEGKGMQIALTMLDASRIGIAAQGLGIAQSALENAVRYSKQRVQFDKAICEFQAIQLMIADMATEIEAARLLTWYAAWLKDNGKSYTKQASMAKLQATETAMRSADRSLQIHGGYGYMREYPIERLFRDAKVTEIYEGTSEIQRLLIAASVLKEYN